MNAPTAKMNASRNTSRANVSSPERIKPDAEGERCRCGVGIRPIVDRPIIVIGKGVRTMITVVTIVAPDMAVRAEIGGVRCAGAVRFRLRRRGDRTDRGRFGD